MFQRKLILWFGIILWGGIAACGNISLPHQQAPIALSPNGLLAQIEAGMTPLILDVRSPQEYAAGHIPGAINIDYRALPQHLDQVRAWQALSTGKIVVYCERGVRARIAEHILQQAGFSAIDLLAGDMARWRRDGLPLEMSPD